MDEEDRANRCFLYRNPFLHILTIRDIDRSTFWMEPGRSKMWFSTTVPDVARVTNFLPYQEEPLFDLTDDDLCPIRLKTFFFWKEQGF